MSDKRMTEQGNKPASGEPAGDERALLEELSAFMDGELDAERSRFLQQRLAHDVALRARWERWQLLSSSMRRQAQPLPPNFADKVARALDAQTVRAAPTHGRRLRWGGGAALAASLVVAGVFVFDAIHQPPSHQLAATIAAITPIQHTVLTPPPPEIKLPIPVESGVVTAFRSPLHPALLREQPHPSFAPFPQPYAIDPELEAYLQRQKTGAAHDVFAEEAANRSDGNDGAVRTVAFPEEQQR